MFLCVCTCRSSGSLSLSCTGSSPPTVVLLSPVGRRLEEGRGPGGRRNCWGWGWGSSFQGLEVDPVYLLYPSEVRIVLVFKVHRGSVSAPTESLVSRLHLVVKGLDSAPTSPLHFLSLSCPLSPLTPWTLLRCGVVSLDPTPYPSSNTSIHPETIKGVLPEPSTTKVPSHSPSVLLREDISGCLRVSTTLRPLTVQPSEWVSRSDVTGVWVVSGSCVPRRGVRGSGGPTGGPSVCPCACVRREWCVTSRSVGVQTHSLRGGFHNSLNETTPLDLPTPFCRCLFVFFTCPGEE